MNQTAPRPARSGRRPRWRAALVGRYSISSVIAGVLSQGAFAASYALGALPSVASAIAFVVGAVPNYLMNRYWAWQQRGRPHAGRELLPYLVIILVTAGAAALVTTAADAFLRARIESDFWLVVLVDAAFIGTYGIMFVLKFVLFDRFVFVPRKDARTPGTTSRSSPGRS